MARLDLPLRSVQSFLAVVRMHSFTEAAVVLNLTQPAITQNVAKLEERLGFKLLERNGSTFVLTQAGHNMLPEFQRIEDDIRRVFQRAREIGAPTSELIKIAAPNSIIAHIIAPTLAQALGGDCFFSLLEIDDETVYDLVRAGEVDIAITSIQGDDTRLDAHTLITDLPCVVFPTGHRFHQDPDSSLSFDDLFSEQYIRLPPGTIAKYFADELSAYADRPFLYSIEATRLLSLQSLIENGLGVAILPGLSAKLLQSSKITYKLIHVSNLSRTSQIIVSKKSSNISLVEKTVSRLISRALDIKEIMGDVCI